MLAGKSCQVRSYRLTSLRRLVRYIFGIQPCESGDGASTSSLMDDDQLVPDNIGVNTNSPQFWATDFEKLINTRDTNSFITCRTETTCYMGLMNRNGITVFEWAKLPYLKFMKVKQFWLPEMPKFFSICHDGKTIRELLVVYEREANIIGFESSQVVDVAVLDELKI